MRRLPSFVLLAALAACSASTASSPTDGRASGPSECNAYFDALVSLSDRCGEAFSSPAHLDEHRARFMTLCENAIRAPGAAHVAGAYLSCANRMNAATSCADIGDCEMPPGDLADGAACLQDFQCQSGYCKSPSRAPGDHALACGSCAPRVQVNEACDFTAHACVDGAVCDEVVLEDSFGAPKCFAVSIAKIGEPCPHAKEGDVQRVRCDEGLHCPKYGDAPTCKPPGQRGDACETKGDCALGLACVCAGDPAQPGGCGGATRKCDVGLPEGATCAFSSYVENEDCAVGLACDSATSTCQKRVFALPGEPCDIFKRCEVGRCQVFGKTSSAGTCVVPLPDGSACGPLDTCDEFSSCIAGKCQKPDAAQCK